MSYKRYFRFELDGKHIGNIGSHDESVDADMAKAAFLQQLPHHSPDIVVREVTEEVFNELKHWEVFAVGANDRWISCGATTALTKQAALEQVNATMPFETSAIKVEEITREQYKKLIADSKADKSPYTCKLCGGPAYIMGHDEKSNNLICTKCGHKTTIAKVESWQKEKVE